MAITFTNTAQAVAGNQPSAPSFGDRVKVDWAGTYTTGGDDFDPLPTIGKGKTIVFIPNQLMSDGNLAVYDRANAKLQVFEFPTSVGPATEIAGSTALSGSAELLVITQ